MTRVGCSRFSRNLTWGEKLGDTKVTLGGRSQKVILGIKVGVEVRVENVRWLTMRSYYESGEMIWDRRVCRRGIYGVNGSHIEK